MKKIIYVLLLVTSVSMMAQEKTVVTVNGEKIKISTKVNNGLTATSGIIQLGGALTQDTKITTSAANSLEINSGGTKATPISTIKIVDGTQTDGFALTSDASGNALWEPIALTVVNGTVPPTRINFVANSDNYLGGYIDLPAGSWAVHCGMLLNPKTGVEFAVPNSCYAARFTLSSNSGALTTSGFKFSGSSLILNTISTGSKTPRYVLFADGIFRVTTTAASTRLYLWNNESVGPGSTGCTEIGSVGGNGENYLYATRIK